ncbi:hypothetical protein HGB07_08085 [Candidatus Roizmanbacteria bacterium]|nr:hypothetical protein [Candidatus Roizmanbacteria bacterium]
MNTITHQTTEVEAILSYILTKADRDNLIEKITAFLDSQYEAKQALYQDHFSYEEAQVFQQAIVQEFGDSPTKENITDFFESLVKSLNELPVVQLVLGFEPRGTFLKKVVEEIRKAGDRYLVDLKIDHSIGGGAVLSTGGRYKDYSLRAILERVTQSD